MEERKEKKGQRERKAEREKGAMFSKKMHGPKAHAKALALKKGVEWESLDTAGRAEMVSAAMRELGPETNAKALALKRGVEWES